MATHSDERARLQPLDAVGWQFTAIRGLGCSYLTLQVATYSNKRSRLQLLQAVG